jgi:hypothetical protein
MFAQTGMSGAQVISLAAYRQKRNGTDLDDTPPPRPFPLGARPSRVDESADTIAQDRVLRQWQLGLQSAR